MSLSVIANVEEAVHVTLPTGCMQHPEYQAQRYMPALDGLRAIAVALVITCHLHETMWNFLSGKVGVIIFFVLSGYLITRLALHEEKVTGKFNVAAFYVRRTFRIFPLYYFVLAIYAFLILWLRIWPTKIQPFHSYLPYYLCYFQEIPAWRHLYNGMPFYQSWSLGIEEKFYLVWPILIITIPARRRDLRFGIVVASATFCILQGIASEGKPVYHLQDYAFIFLGVSLALLLSSPASYNTFARTARRVATPALAIVLITQFYLMPYKHVRGLSTLYAMALTIVIGALVTSRGVANRLLSAPSLVLVGKLSYGIYLVHILCLSAVEKIAKPGLGIAVGVVAYVGTVLLSTGVAYILNRSLEKPMIVLGRQLADRLRPANSSVTDF
jgi:peptidoglycan/LPS O-acetylase OafA/YrhL